MPRAPNAKNLPFNWYKPPIPVEQRKQVYLPEFTITLIRTPFLPPRYASFWVPLSFNKLDMKDYLKRLYNVDVIKVRSYVEQQKVTRERPMGKQGYGPLRRPMAKKKMTVEMIEPFVWPEAPTDFSPWERDAFFEAKKMQEDFQESQTPDALTKAPERQRGLLAEQVKRLKEGKESWQPTWQALGLNFERPLFRPQPTLSSETARHGAEVK
ncbi:mitochondrial 54S ribosomal protein YmL41 [Emydomyces testavorans]|uniref:Large ribosomal subunit protein uL23m n=1 Tax=Emydomyces testavorans TaxID=2070801 RepID=A0AAF0DLR2_9EURO|nr:mitochondrial 54S ribosomal protein YmL41 [Emydomyces testavorans]